MTLILRTGTIATNSVGNLYGIDGPSDVAALLDFERGFYRVNEGGEMVDIDLTSAMESFRNLPSYRFDGAGNAVEAPANTMRITTTRGNEGRLPVGLKGLVSEPNVVNYLLNSFAPATQSVNLTAGNYTLSVYGNGSASVTGGTITSNAGISASEGSPVTISVNATGSVTVTVVGTLSIFQLENFLCPTTPIKTLGTSAPRGADRFELLDRVFDTFTGGEGTIICDFSPYNAPTSSAFLYRISRPVGQGANGNIQAQLQNGNNFYTAAQNDAGAVLFAINSATGGLGQNFRGALAYGDNDFAAGVERQSITTDSNGVLPTSLTRFEIGGSDVASAFAAGVYRKFVFYNRRLSNAELATVFSG